MKVLVWNIQGAEKPSSLIFEGLCYCIILVYVFFLKPDLVVLVWNVLVTVFRPIEVLMQSNLKVCLEGLLLCEILGLLELMCFIVHLSMWLLLLRNPTSILGSCQGCISIDYRERGILWEEITILVNQGIPTVVAVDFNNVQ